MAFWSIEDANAIWFYLWKAKIALFTTKKINRSFYSIYTIHSKSHYVEPIDCDATIANFFLRFKFNIVSFVYFHFISEV